MPTAAELAKLRVVDLKARLDKEGLPTNGVKATLVAVGAKFGFNKIKYVLLKCGLGFKPSKCDDSCPETS